MNVATDICFLYVMFMDGFTGGIGGVTLNFLSFFVNGSLEWYSLNSHSLDRRFSLVKASYPFNSTSTYPGAIQQRVPLFNLVIINRRKHYANQGDV